MKNMKQATRLLALPLLFVSAGVMADVTCGTYASKHAEGGAQSQVGDAMVILLHNKMQVNSDKGGRFSHMTGDCGGTASVLSDSSIHTVGNCTIADASGDIALYHFIVKRGEKRGRFFRSGGTGKFAKEHGEGWFQQTAQDEQGASGIWGGKTAALCK